MREDDTKIKWDSSQESKFPRNSKTNHAICTKKSHGGLKIEEHIHKPDKIQYAFLLELHVENYAISVKFKTYINGKMFMCWRT